MFAHIVRKKPGLHYRIWLTFIIIIVVFVVVVIVYLFIYIIIIIVVVVVNFFILKFGFN